MKTLLSPLTRSAGAGLAFAVAAALPLSAVPVVTLDPVTQTIPVGGTAVVNLNISGLEDNLPPALGAWLAEIAFDAGIVSLTDLDVTFGTNLDLGVFGTIEFVDTSLVNWVQAGQTSFEDSDALAAAQPGSFLLATYSFTGVAPGITSLSFERLELSDEIGFPMSFTSAGASINVGGVTPRVPDHGSLGLMVALLFGALIAVREYHARHRVQTPARSK